MNSLNSVLIEGAVKDVAFETNEKGKEVCNFTIISYRNEEESCFAVIVTGELAKTCKKLLAEGKTARIVGRLKKTEGSVVIAAEHLEVRK